MFYEGNHILRPSHVDFWPKYRHLYCFALLVYSVIIGSAWADDNDITSRYMKDISVDTLDSHLSTIGCPDSGLPKFDGKTFTEKPAKEFNGDPTVPTIITVRQYGLSYVKYMHNKHGVQTHETHVDVFEAPSSMVDLFDGRISRHNVSKKSQKISHHPAHEGQNRKDASNFSQYINGSYVLYEFDNKN